MFNKLFLLVSFVLLPISIGAQECKFTISGQIFDQGTNEYLVSANVFLNELGKGSTTDDQGYFIINNLCPGDYHLIISHIGCETQTVFVSLIRDTTLTLELEHSTHILNAVTVTGSTAPATTQSLISLSEQQITDNASLNLSNMLENLAGVSTIKNGSGISKPVVDGLYGNRLTILNNGITQGGQQWGNDHSPEIDPLVANSIQVIKGVNALAYLGANLGGVVLVEPKKIGREPHLHGNVTYFLSSNGWDNGLNVRLQKYSPSLAWRVNGTIKKSGDRKTADYYLNNTGVNETNMAVQLEKSYNDKLFAKFYLSSYNATLGVLRGSHIGNLSDLQEAFSRELPFFTESDFSFQINAPKQKVSHHLAKLKFDYFINNDDRLEFTVASQLNLRREFDVRRSGRSDIPALNLKQYSHFVESVYLKKIGDSWKIRSGAQLNVIDNTNDPETGIAPLIPDYISFQTGWFALLSRDTDKMAVELGLRYDYIYQHAAVITLQPPREVVRYKSNFNNIGASAGLTYRPAESVSISSNIGIGQRNPAINELYSGGLHQGVSGLELGNEFLNSEKSIKSTLDLKVQAGHWLYFESLIYYQRFNDYIFLNPQNETRLTIRGAFPVFRYEQTDARLNGFDLSSKIQYNDNWQTKLVYSFIKGKDLIADLPLINIPSNNLQLSLAYQFKSNNPDQKLVFENSQIELVSRTVFRRSDILAFQDFVLPPDSYHLIGLKFSTEVQLNTLRVRLGVRVDNLLNIAYRDYLNRQRYFADDLGRNMGINVSVSF